VGGKIVTTALYDHGRDKGDEAPMTYKRKLIEVALPLDAISRESARDPRLGRGHPRTLHLWWARRPIAAARAVLWASLVDDPTAHPDRFPTEEDQAAERKRLFGILQRLVVWENSSNHDVLSEARAEIESSCDGDLPNILDPFCGGGAIPLEAQRLGLPAYGGDLNPVAVLISKALVEIPHRFAGLPPVNPDARAESGLKTWERAQGLAEDIGFYGEWMRDQAFERIGHLYPKVALPESEGGGEANVIAWIWARTVRSSDPSWNGHVPLVRSWVVRKAKKNKPLVWVEPVVNRNSQTISYRIRTKEEGDIPKPTIARSAATCIATGTPIPRDYLRREASEGRIGTHLLTVVAEGGRGRVFVEPKVVPRVDRPDNVPSGKLSTNSRHMSPPAYGLTTTDSLFTDRQLVALAEFSNLLAEMRPVIEDHAYAAGLNEEGVRLRDGGSGVTAYADAVTTYLAFAIDRCAAMWVSLTRWNSVGEKLQHLFGRQAIPMVWDYAEANPFSRLSGNWSGQVIWIQKAVAGLPAEGYGLVRQENAVASLGEVESPLICTDPPYYDNVPYADIADFFYVWLRHNLSDIWPAETATLLTPKADELVADPHRIAQALPDEPGLPKELARRHFEKGMAKVLKEISTSQHSAFPVSIFYAFKQQETRQGSAVSTGWETFLQGLIDAGFQIMATWPIRTEMSSRMRAMASAALASSVVVACRLRSADAPLATRREFLDTLEAELPRAVRLLQDQAIAPVDMAQSAIGPGMEIFSRYAKVLEADGTPMRIRTALALINEALEEALSEEETEFDGDTRWALTWYEQFGHDRGPFGDAETLAKAKNTSVEGVVRAGVAESQAGKVRLLARERADDEWDPAKDTRLTVWKVAQQLAARLEDGEAHAADLLRAVGGGVGDRARRLAYLLYQIADRKGRSEDAVAYNGLVQTWHDIARLAGPPGPVAQTLEGI
jgi:putative DNA methylase